MKKFYSIWLLVLTLFSSVIFSACGDKFKKLSMEFFDEQGNSISAVEFLIDKNTEELPEQTIAIEFKNIDKDDVGQVTVYSKPFELVEVLNYRYENSKCFVTLMAKMSSGEDAELVVHHLSSGKKQAVELNIEQKTKTLDVNSDLQYIIGIPENDPKDEGVNHYVDFSQLVSLTPGSTDEIFFKLIDRASNTGVAPIKLTDMDNYKHLKGTAFDDVYAGFNVKRNADVGEISIYPVTYVEGYEKNEAEIKKFKNKSITIKFRHLLNESNVEMYAENVEDFKDLQLIANDETLLDTMVITPKLYDSSKPEGEKYQDISDVYYEIYKLNTSEIDNQLISATIDAASNQIILTAHERTEDYHEIKVVFDPVGKNSIGDVKRVEKTIKVKGVLEPEQIKVVKGELGEETVISEGTSINIFNYYSEGNSLGARFRFEAKTVNNYAVEEQLSSMRIVVDRNILSENNLPTEFAEASKNSKYALELYVSGRLMSFYAIDGDETNLQSEPISKASDVRIKYVDNGGESDNPLRMSIKSQDTSEIAYWDSTKTTISRVINFNTIEGVKSLDIQAGSFSCESNEIYNTIDSNNPSHIYLNRNHTTNGEQLAYYISILNKSVLDVNDVSLANVDFEVKVKSLNNATNPLKIMEKIISKDGVIVANGATNEIIHKYSDTETKDVIGLVIEENTQIGEYLIEISQDGRVKKTVICVVYDTIEEIKAEDVELFRLKSENELEISENSEKAFLNISNSEPKYSQYAKAQYIVASGEMLKAYVKLPEDVIASNMIDSYKFEYSMSDGENIFTPNGLVEDYVEFAERKNNFAILNYKQGTYVEGVKYVKLDINIKVNTFTNIITKGEAQELATAVSIYFFIYEEITEQDVSINYQELTLNPLERLGKYNEKDSTATLIMKLDDTLKNYIDLESIVWKVDGSTGVINYFDFIQNAEDKTICQIASRVGDSSQYNKTVSVEFNQFGNRFVRECVIYIEDPIISERVIITSEVGRTDDSEQSYYINLKAGDEYHVEAQNYSEIGEVTRKGFVIQIVDEYGVGFYTQDYFDINQENLTIRVKKVDSARKFKLVVFAKDALSEIIFASHNLANPADYLIVWNSITAPNQFKRAYFVADIILSDGTEANPYLINTAKDFWEIDNSDDFKTKYYMLMTSISLKNSSNEIEGPIRNFSGSITTYEKNIYKIYDIDLNNIQKNLFSNFTGNMFGIQFGVNFSYDLNSTNTEYLGVFDILGSEAELTNVGVEVAGNIKLNGSGDFYFGSLVAKNNQAKIEYVSKITENQKDYYYTNIVGVQGTLTFAGTSKVYIGGLVGENLGIINGSEELVIGGETSIKFSSSQGRTNALSSIIIASNMQTTSESAIGGVIGLNKGVIKNAYVQAKIQAPLNSNIGGVVGYNQQENQTVELDNNVNVNLLVLQALLSGGAYSDANSNISASIQNVKSASIIYGLDNVGGITGLDLNGCYLNCDYQITNINNEISVLTGMNNVGGIAGKSTYGKFFYCSVMSYKWDYQVLKSDKATDLISNVALEDINGNNYVGGIVGMAISSNNAYSSNGENCSERTLVAYSTVNAYIKSANAVGGILTSNIDKEDAISNNVLTNVYFIGKADGVMNYYVAPGTTQYLALSNDYRTVSVTTAYSVNIGNKTGGGYELVVGAIKNGSIWNITDGTDIIDLNYWLHDDSINGGYVFVTADNNLPIFDVAPEKIDVTVKNADENLETVLRLDYYDFTINSGLKEEYLNVLNKKYNIINNILDILNIEVYPANLGTVVLSVKSSNTQVVEVSLSGEMKIKGVGTCKLTFASVLNADIKAEVEVVVDYPLGDFNISLNPIDKSKIINGKTVEIPKGSSKQFYVLTEGKESLDLDSNGVEEYYSFKTKTNPNLNVTITLQDVDIEKYLKTSGIKLSAETGKLQMKIDSNTPFMISVLQKYDTSSFAFEVQPYVTIKGVDVYYLENGYTTDSNIDSILKNDFELSTMAGATKVSFSYDESTVYLNDTVSLTAQIKTDVDLAKGDNEQEQIQNLQAIINEILDGNLCGNLAPNVHLILSSSSIDIKNCVSIVVQGVSYNQELELQTIDFKIEFSDIDFTKKQEHDFRFRIELSNEYAQNKFANVDYTVLSQRINKIEIKNYYFDNGKKILYDVLKPLTAGEMIIDMVPNNAYYDYLEISDITGNEEILFIQVDDEGNALSVDSDVSSDRKGIKLYPTDEIGRIRVKTQIDRNYTSKMHTVEVRAYSADGTLLHSNKKLIDVKMLPEITMQYVLPSGDEGTTVNTSIEQTHLLANGASAHLTIQTRNTTEDFKSEISGDLKDYYELVNTSGYHYELRRKSSEISSTDIGKKVKLTIWAYAYMGAGSYEESMCSLEFEITNFVVHSVSVNNSIDDEIYGYYNNPLKLEFFFDETDISFYNTEATFNPLWDTQYRYSEGIEEITSDLNLKQIYAILEELNGWDTEEDLNSYVVLNDGDKDNVSNKYDPIYQQGEKTPATQKFKLDNALDGKQINNVLTVKDGYNDDDKKYLAIAFRLEWDESVTLNKKWKIDTTWSNYESTSPSNASSYVIDVNYELAFRPATKWYEPEVIVTNEDFEEMESGGRYILKTDLTFEKYTPLNVDLVEFDGNGHTITIKGFDALTNAEIKAGLFEQTYENMIVKNLTVVYETKELDTGGYSLGNVDVNNKKIIYADLCNDEAVAYTSARFGGITAVNNGVITNCKVMGSVALMASVVEQQASNSSSYDIDFYIGGMVAENSSTGYITNSTTALSVFSQANIGGFTYSNRGKIASCSVETILRDSKESSATIYGYHQGIDKTIIVEIAGFAVENTGDISMSYIDLKTNKDNSTEFKSSTYFGTMSAKDISAGFVYKNSGNIADAFVKTTAMGTNNNTFAGFVYENNGTVIRAYTFINMGVKQEKKDSMFAPIATQGISSSIEFVNSQIGYANQVEGLETVESIHRYNQRYYEQAGFAFGSKESGAVWMMNNADTATIVAVQEKVDQQDLIKITSTEVLEDGELKTKYDFDFGTYGTKANPYILSDLTSWDDFFSEESSYYMNASYRVVKDIDFTSLGSNPSTSSKTFRGNIQGNNMILNNVMLYSNKSLESIGLFAKLEGISDPSVHCAVRNLTIKASSVWASSTKAVGVLAGIVDGFDIYNITIDAEGVIMVGKNAVGGLTGVIEGNSDVDLIHSNIGANSTRASVLNTYAIYISKNNNATPNLSNVYYAGSVAGIVDLYNSSSFDVNLSREVNENYFAVKNIDVSGRMVLAGDTVGGAFGMIGEKVKLENAKVNITGAINGSQYSAGLVGENRGIIQNASAILEAETMTNARYVSAGLVGLNLGGLVRNVEATSYMTFNNYGYTVGGIVGRNVYGTIQYAKFNGELDAYFTGGIVGANYSSQMLRTATTGTGAMSSECKENKNLFASMQVTYTLDGKTLKNFENVSININTFNKMVEDSNSFYTYQPLKESEAIAQSLKEITKGNKVLGVLIGISYTDSQIIDVNENIYAVEVDSSQVTFNKPSFSSSLKFCEGTDVKDIVLKDAEVEEDKIKFTFTSGVNVLETSRDVPCVMYLIGAVAPSFNAWENYSNTYILLNKAQD